MEPWKRKYVLINHLAMLRLHKKVKYRKRLYINYNKHKYLFIYCKQDFNKHTLFMRYEVNGKVLIVFLYVDDLIFTGNDDVIIRKFKKSMMSDLGLM
ncbi:hypothetical protein CR513_52296, partial [Mucuna pruriens]